MSTIKICDKCGVTVAFLGLHLVGPLNNIDLCRKCKLEFFDWLNEKEKENAKE